MFEIQIEKNAEKDIRKLPTEQINRTIDKIKSLAENPIPEGCRKLQSNEDYYRIRDGNYRIVYSIDFKNNIVKIYRVRHRKSVYTNL